MTTLTAPASGGFTLIDADVYDATIRDVEIQDWTQKPDNFGKQGHHTFIFKFDVDVPDMDAPEDLWKYIGFYTGEKATLTKLTRALGDDDLAPGDPVNTNAWIGRRLRVNVSQAEGANGLKNRIEGFLPAKKAKPTAQPAPARRPAPVVEDDDDANVSF